MDWVTETQALSIWLLKYGSFLLFFMLALGIVALPIPEETLMVMAGLLMHQGRLNLPLTIFFAYAGSLCGITMSYFLGRTFGHYLVRRQKWWFGLTAERLERVHYWFRRFGKWLLFIGYFIPGVRHFTGFFAGMSGLEYKFFALFAYSGALLWVSLFLSLGYFLGTHWISITTLLENFDLMTLLLLVPLFLLGLFCFQKYKNRF